MKPVRQFLNRHFIGKLRGKNLPLFCYAVKLKFYQPIGTYAVLQPEIGPTFGREEIETWHRLSQELWNSRRKSLYTQKLPQFPPLTCLYSGHLFRYLLNRYSQNSKEKGLAA